MTDPAASRPVPATTVEDVHPRGSRWLWVLPAVALLVGLGLGALLFGTVGSDGAEDDSGAEAQDSPEGSGSASPGPSPSPSPSDLLVRVPEPCLAVADEAQSAFAVFDRAVDAAREFDARRLAEVVDEVQELRPRVDELAAQCRQRAGQDLAAGTAVTPTPTPPTTTAPTPTPATSPTPPPTPTPSV